MSVRAIYEISIRIQHQTLILILHQFLSFLLLLVPHFILNFFAFAHQVFHAPSIQQEIPFEFRIRYKFLSHSEAVVRYGSSPELYDLGLVTPGTYCTRQFEECYRNKCRLQSPNYPGMYPRNVTCYWTVRQKNLPTCKHAMIAVSQENSHKSLVKRSIASLNKTTRTVRAWSGELIIFFWQQLR
jgi:hypothetical protein